jgi:anti-sigma factor RsiW
MKLFERKPAPIPCREVVETVTAYLEGTLPRRDEARLRAHLEACGHCHEYVEQIRATIALTGAIEPEDLSPEATEALTGAFRAWAAEGA